MPNIVFEEGSGVSCLIHLGKKKIFGKPRLNLLPRRDREREIIETEDCKQAMRVSGRMQGDGKETELYVKKKMYVCLQLLFCTFGILKWRWQSERHPVDYCTLLWNK